MSDKGTHRSSKHKKLKISKHRNSILGSIGGGAGASNSATDIPTMQAGCDINQVPTSAGAGYTAGQ
jgi:hypothetical protein